MTSRRRFAKGVLLHFFGRPSLRENGAHWTVCQVQQRAENVTSKTMLNYTSTKLHKIAVEKKFSDLTQLNWRHGEKRKLAQHNMSHRVSMLGMQSTGGERQAKRGVSRLAVLHICFSIKTCFAAPLLSDKRSAAYDPSLFCTPPEIELL